MDIDASLCTKKNSIYQQISIQLYFPPFVVISQPYDIRVEGNEVFSGNVAFLRCFISEHARKYVVVLSWLRGDEELHADMADIGKLKSH